MRTNSSFENIPRRTVSTSSSSFISRNDHSPICSIERIIVGVRITNVRTTTVQASSRTFKSNGRTYIEKHNDNTLNTVLYQKVSGRYKQVAKSSTYLIYRFSYGKKLYFSSADDETSDIPWVIFEHFLGM